MEKRITSVQWSASNLPAGLSFDTATGTFSGTPGEAGDYTVPVTVRTNYGEDMKDVLVSIAETAKGHFVYSITPGNVNYAQNWSNNVSPDENGFYMLPVPKVEKLSEWMGGFCAYSENGDIYRCGYEGLSFSNKEGFYYSEYPSIIKEAFDVSKPITAICCKTYTNGTSTLVMSRDLYATLTSNGQLTFIKGVDSQKKNAYGSTSTTTYSHIKREYGEISCDYDLSHVTCFHKYSQGFRWLSEDGLQFYTISVIGDYENLASKTTFTVTDLGYKAKKIINVYSEKTYPFILTDDGKVNTEENSDTFPYGVATNLWGYSKTIYVPTTDNSLYKYNPSNKGWDLLGNFDIKKIIIKSTTSSATAPTFMLTNDGKLYHMGDKVKGNIADKHSEFTQIFPDCHFYDFTIDDENTNTLTVLKN